MDELAKNQQISRDAKIAQNALDMIDLIIEELDKSADRRMFSMVKDKGVSISSEDTAAYAGEKLAYSEIKKKLTKKITMGMSANKRLSEQMTLTS